METRKARAVRSCLAKPASPAVAVLYHELGRALKDWRRTKADHERGAIGSNDMMEAAACYRAIVRTLSNLSVRLNGNDAAVWQAALSSSPEALDTLLWQLERHICV